MENMTDKQLLNIYETLKEDDEDEEGVCTSITRELVWVRNKLIERGYLLEEEEY